MKYLRISHLSFSIPAIYFNYVIEFITSVHAGNALILKTFSITSILSYIHTHVFLTKSNFDKKHNHVKSKNVEAYIYFQHSQ